MIINRFTSFMLWRPFVVGFLLSVFVASLSGFVFTRKNAFRGFVRFHLSISPEALYLPTARQIATLVNELDAANKTLVLIGGSSVLRGTGQRESEVWTRALQDELGRQFVVVNLAMNGGAAPGAASYMTEMLTKMGRQAILVSDMLPDTWRPDSVNQHYRYLYFEAEARGYLFSSKLRSRYIELSADEETASLRIRGLANGVLNFQELWHYLGYCCFFTVYAPVMANAPWTARQYMPDEEVPTTNYRTLPEDVTAREREISRSYSNINVDWEKQKEGIRIAFPDEIRRRIIIATTGQSPFYMNQLQAAEREAINQYYALWAQALGQEGVTAAFADRLFDEEDHYNRVHLSERGGRSFAKFLAPFIRKKAKDLGYER